MEYNIEETYTELVEAVNLVMNPCTSANQRAEAHKMLEAFKETSPLCAKCGFLLSAKGNHPTIRHFGLRLIDHYLKLHWNDIDCEEKLWIKDNVIQLIGTDAESATKEETYIKDALSRIVVEIIKREWPQQWPSLMEELHALCTMGDSQTELVLLVFLRLAEDIVQFQNIPEQRRKEIYKTLCSHLNELFAFFLKTVSENCNKYFSNKQSGILTKARMHCRVAQVALETLSVFVEWVPVNHITETSLIKHLCVLLEDEELRTHAAQCLLSILDRKGKFEDRKELMLLVFDENSIFIPASAVDVVNEQHYLFLKVLCQMLVALGVNLCGVMAQFPNLEVPKTFSKYLNSILLFSKHPSMVLSHQTQNLWMAIFRSPSISQSPTLHEIIPNLLLCEAEKLLKPNSPLEYDLESPTDCLKFDTEEDFEASFNRYRADVIDVIRFITKIQPKLSFSLGSSLLKSLIHGEGWTQVFGSSVSRNKNLK
ncbi:exportin-5-like [Stegodyphus dumicola]|uniref:exportin-5-like n=1 Tax=Stegodyphus dumicola TaxID=202533 RepID=UPI0015B1B4A7|nr:exportin-5-like [Stegodyphus dumicola]